MLISTLDGLEVDTLRSRDIAAELANVNMTKLLLNMEPKSTFANIMVPEQTARLHLIPAVASRSTGQRLRRRRLQRGKVIELLLHHGRLQMRPVIVLADRHYMLCACWVITSQPKCSSTEALIHFRTLHHSFDLRY